MIRLSSLARGLFLCAVTIVLVASSLEAQTRVRVTRDQAVIWRPGFTTMAGVVTEGTELAVVARRGNWYEVLLPANLTTSGRTGLISVVQVEVIEGTAADAGSPVSRGPASPPIGVPTPERTGSSAAPSSSAVRGFGHLGYGMFNAHNTFDAVIGQPGGLWYGGGGEFKLTDRLFVQASVEQFRRTGERVFVFNGKVFKLGVPDTVTMTPLAFTAGYRFTRRGVVPYAGGGVGRHFFRETSTAGDQSDNVKQQFTSYHVLGGVEFHRTLWVTTAFEVQYSHLPNSLSSDVSAAFNEHNLGGTEARIKVIVGK